MADQPSKGDIEAVFHRLRAIPANKACFDCNAKNPTWASITYGIFICIDCSAVHRSLGVHLTFVRSTQLDTNWTWVQLRQMQLGGNANALQFFSQHNCVTTDAQKKYNSRAAQLYREKLHQLAIKAMQNNSQLHIHGHSEDRQEDSEKEVDFFSEHENFTSPDLPVKASFDNETPIPKEEEQHPTEGPKVDLEPVESNLSDRKSTIGVRKVQPRRSGLGAKKGGLGATKVKTNFADIEKEAALAEETRLRNIEESVKAEALLAKEREEKEAALRLAYKDFTNEQNKREEQLKQADPRKAEQVERLGMGFNARSGVSHSITSDLKTIEQENVESRTSSLNSLGKLRLSDNDGFFDNFSSYSSGFSMNRNSSSSSSATRGLEALLASEKEKSKDSWVIVDDPVIDKPKSVSSRPVERSSARNSSYSDSSNSDIAQKKFGSAKGISSDQFFGDKNNDYEVQANLSRFQGSSSISSSEFFGHGSDDAASYSKFQAPDLDEVRESVRQGVTKVAGKLSSLANGVMSSIQERYGY